MSSRIPLLCLTAMVVLAAGADEPAKTQTVNVGSVSFEAPASWKSITPKTAMRKAQMKIQPTAGETTEGDLSIYVFPEGAGTVQANVDRWQAQFKDNDGKTPPVESKKLKGKNVDVTKVTCAGTFTDPFAGTGPQKGFRLLGAIVEIPEGGYYLKLVGPDKTLAAAEKDFDALVSTISRK